VVLPGPAPTPVPVPASVSVASRLDFSDDAGEGPLESPVLGRVTAKVAD
jgi:hypothetical protein